MMAPKGSQCGLNGLVARLGSHKAREMHNRLNQALLT